MGRPTKLTPETQKRIIDALKIGATRLGRRCRAVEISPAYVAVTLQRWADLTGKTPVLLERQGS